MKGRDSWQKTFLILYCQLILTPMSRTRREKYQLLIVKLATTVENQERRILTDLKTDDLAVTVENREIVLATAVLEYFSSQFAVA